MPRALLMAVYTVCQKKILANPTSGIPPAITSEVKGKAFGYGFCKFDMPAMLPVPTL